MTAVPDLIETPHSGDAPESRHWFLVQCRQGQNRRARENLEQQGYSCFDPKLRVERLKRGRREIHKESLFPGYLFIHLALSGESWHSIRSTRGVRQLVRFGTDPARVPDGVIEQLRLRSQGEQEDTRPALEHGERLRIKQGPFAELEGVFQRFDGEERVIVLFEMLQKQHRLTLNVGDIEQT